MANISGRNDDADETDFYPTPAEATQALLDRVKFEGSIWEPACGEGHISKVLIANGYRVISTDLYDRGYGRFGQDFLKSEKTADNVITNPPFSLTDDFIIHALARAKNKVAMIMRLTYLQGIGRYNRIFSPYPPSKILIFANRPSMIPEDKRKGSKGRMVCYLWAVWDNQRTGPTELEWLPEKFK